MSDHIHHARLFRIPDNLPITAVVSSVVTDEEVYTYTFSTVQIDDVRELIARANRRPTEARYQLLIIGAERLTHEAQNALLKLLEEPPATTRFCLMVRPHTPLLATVLSRCQLESVVISQNEITHDPRVVTFLTAPPSLRLRQIAEAHTKKDEVWFSIMQAFLFSPPAQRYIQSPALAPLLRYLTMRGAAKKMIWEEIAFQLPVEGRS